MTIRRGRCTIKVPFPFFTYPPICMKLHLIILSLVVSLSAFSQKLYKDYTFYPQETGKLYFILPQKGFQSDDPTVVKGLEYDLTYFTASDSATLAYTYTTHTIYASDSVSLVSPEGNVLYTEKATMLFVQPHKKQWQQRASTQIPYALLTELYKQKEPFRVRIHSSRQTLDYTLKRSKWEKQSFLLSRIFEIIKYNDFKN